MTEPATGSFLGVKYASLVAGFAGGVISLAYLRSLTHGQMVLAVISGTACAGYLSPVLLPALAHLTGITLTAPIENAAAFLLGLTSMNIVPGLLKLSELFGRDPAGLISGITRGKDRAP